MPSNQALYTDAMKKASNSAWDQNWNAAVLEYRRALAEFPDDLSARRGLAQALTEGGLLEEGLKEYQMSQKLQPGDPAILSRISSLFERLGRKDEGTAAYLELAELYLAGGEKSLALDAWRRAAGLDPDRADIREKLIGAYREMGRPGAAAQELANLARLYNRQGDGVRVDLALNQALELDPNNAAAKTLREELSGHPNSAQPFLGSNPVDDVRRSSLARLAQTVFDDGPRWRSGPPATEGRRSGVDVEALVARAIDAQTHGRPANAIVYYEQIMQAGIARSEVRFNLALLYQAVERYDEATSLLKQTTGDSEFALASYITLGQCYQSQGRADSALESYLQAMRIIDVSNVKREQVDEVIQVYESLAQGYRARGAAADAERSIDSLVQLLNGRGWEDKVREVREHLSAVSQTGTPISLAEVLETRDAERVIQALRLSSSYLEQGHYQAASDEALRAIEIAPNYLPGHVQVAEILEQTKRLPEARFKYDRLTETAEARGDLPKAISFCRRALALTPDDISLRSRLIELLQSQGLGTEAVNEVINLGAILERGGETQKAQDHYADALRVVEESNAPAAAATTLRKQLAESYLKAREWRNALPLYEQLGATNPDDERTHFILTELYFRAGQPDKGERELNDLLARCGRNTNKTRAILTTLARNLPHEIPVTLRLARFHAGLGERNQAIEVLDRLGDYLLNAGQRDGALVVIREIIALNPPQVQEYRRLLDELTADNPPPA